MVDEPLYAHYLTKINPSAFRPYRDEVPVGLGFEGLGFMVHGLGFRVQGSGCRV